MAGLRPSERGAANLRPSLMIDLQREQEKYPAYHPIHCPDGLIDISSAENRLMLKEIDAWSRRASEALLHDLSNCRIAGSMTTCSLTAWIMAYADGTSLDR